MRTAAAIAVGIAVAMFTSALAIGLRAPLAATSLRGLAIWTALVQLLMIGLAVWWGVRTTSGHPRRVAAASD